MATPLEFSKALLNRLGISHSQNRLVGLVAFAAAEGGHWHNAARYNPMNTTLSMPGATNAVGAVKAYMNWEQGIEATARTMAQPNMRPIIDALRADADPQVFLASVTKTPWCPQSAPGCSAYENMNAIVLYNARANEQDGAASLPQGEIASWISEHPYITSGLVLGALGIGWLVLSERGRSILRAQGIEIFENPPRRRRRLATKGFQLGDQVVMLAGKQMGASSLKQDWPGEIDRIETSTTGTTFYGVSYVDRKGKRRHTYADPHELK